MKNTPSAYPEDTFSAADYILKKNYLLENIDDSVEKKEATPWQKIIDDFNKRKYEPEKWEFSNKIIHYINPNPTERFVPCLIVETNTPKPMLTVMVPGNPCRIDCYTLDEYKLYHESLNVFDDTEFKKWVRFYQETEFSKNEPLPSISNL